ncbi:protein FAM72A-like [Babylonia areolata]|uniref:protein FAM72A-like n=1 Tax=Babylonia areolata TaxID=304850 RepID=UPI003FD6361C
MWTTSVPASGAALCTFWSARGAGRRCRGGPCGPFSWPDKRIELFSTDSPDYNAIGVVPEVFTTAHCYCKIQKIACRCCGSEVGYHVLTPCARCLSSCNNGHFWMFDSDSVVSSGRMNPTDGDYIIWKNLSPPGEDDFLECLR